MCVCEKDNCIMWTLPKKKPIIIVFRFKCFLFKQKYSVTYNALRDTYSIVMRNQYLDIINKYCASVWIISVYYVRIAVDFDLQRFTRFALIKNHFRTI